MPVGSFACKSICQPNKYCYRNAATILTVPSFFKKKKRKTSWIYLVQSDHSTWIEDDIAGSVKISLKNQQFFKKFTKVTKGFVEQTL